MQKPWGYKTKEIPFYWKDVHTLMEEPSALTAEVHHTKFSDATGHLVAVLTVTYEVPVKYHKLHTCNYNAHTISIKSSM